MDPIRIPAGFAYGPLINPPPSRKINYKYNSYVDLYSGVVLFSFIFRVYFFRVRARVKNRF